MRNETDHIDIEGLAVRTVIGIFDEERERRQEVVINLRLFADLRSASRSDHIDDAIDYKRVTKEVIRFVENSSFFLVETLAERLAERILECFAVECITVRVEKPGALRYCRTVSVTITRTREE